MARWWPTRGRSSPGRATTRRADRIGLRGPEPASLLRLPPLAAEHRKRVRDRTVAVGVDGHADVARLDLEVRGRGIEAGLPLHDAVALRVDREEAGAARN